MNMSTQENVRSTLYNESIGTKDEFNKIMNKDIMNMYNSSGGSQVELLR